MCWTKIKNEVHIQPEFTTRSANGSRCAVDNIASKVRKRQPAFLFEKFAKMADIIKSQFVSNLFHTLW